jgi:hypothetical protein
MQLHRKRNKAVFIQYINNYWWYSECVKLRMVIRQMKRLRTSVLEF